MSELSPEERRLRAQLAGLSNADTSMLTVTAVAHRLAVSKSTVYELLGSGALAHHNIGGRKVVALADLERYLDGCRVASVAEERAAAGSPVPLPKRKGGRAA